MPQKTQKIQKAMAIGAIWMTSLRMSYRVIGFVSTMILARLLTPEDFGIVAIAMSFFSLIDIFSQFGFQTVLIQTKHASKEHYDTAWSYNFILGFVTACILIAISGSVASFYENEGLKKILWAVAFLFVINGAKNVGVIDFQKNMTFDKEFRLHVIPKFISFFITISLAFIYLNYWALVIGNLIWKTLELIASYYMHPHRPRICFKKSKELFNFSKWLMINNIFTFLNERSPELIIGKLISPPAAAFYNIAQEVAATTTTEIIANLNRAIYPGYAKASSEKSMLQQLYSNSLRIIALIAIPLGVGVALVSPLLVPLLLGNQWLEAITPLVYLAIGGSINALSTNNAYVYFALGKPKIVTGVALFRATVFISSMYFLIESNGITGAAIAFLVTSTISFITSNILINIVLGVSLLQQLSFYIKPTLSALLMVFAVKLFLNNIELNSVSFLLISVSIGAASYTLGLYILWILTGKKRGPEQQILELLSNQVLQLLTTRRQASS